MAEGEIGAIGVKLLAEPLLCIAGHCVTLRKEERMKWMLDDEVA